MRNTATVRDLTGLDGCGFVFELHDGTRVMPTWDASPFCGFSMSMDVAADPLYSFEFVNGKQVLIGFEERADWASVCMSARPVKITCLEEVETVTL